MSQYISAAHRYNVGVCDEKRKRKKIVIIKIKMFTKQYNICHYTPCYVYADDTYYYNYDRNYDHE